MSLKVINVIKPCRSHLRLMTFTVFKICNEVHLVNISIIYKDYLCLVLALWRAHLHVNLVHGFVFFWSIKEAVLCAYIWPGTLSRCVLLSRHFQLFAELMMSCVMICTLRQLPYCIYWFFFKISVDVFHLCLRCISICDVRMQSSIQTCVMSFMLAPPVPTSGVFGFRVSITLNFAFFVDI